MIRKDSPARSTVDRSGVLTDKAAGESSGTMTNSAPNDQEPAFIEVGEGDGRRRIAVRARAGAAPGSTSGAPGSTSRAPGLFWLGGFNSDMRGTKALALDEWAAKYGRACARFDYSGHGESGGAFIDGTIGRWLEESVAVFEQFCRGPQVVIGSSMGGWMALLLARAIANRGAAAASLAGLVLIAPAPDFTEQLMWNGFSPEIRDEITTKGVWMRPSEYGDGTPYPITRALIEEGRNHLLLGSAIEVGCPVRILQGAQDPDVPWQHAFALAHRLPADDVVMTMIQDGDHRLSRPQDIARILAAVAEI
jgi:pimeloyl-ACP methyl ester carboxylesterase